MDLIDLKFKGEKNPSGTGTFISVIPLDDLETIQGLPASPATMAERLVIATDHVVKTGKKWIQIDLDLDENEFNGEGIEESLGSSDKLEFTGLIPNFSDEINGSLDYVGNMKCMVMVHLLDGKVLQLGDENIHAEIYKKFATGKVSSGTRGYSLTIRSYGSIVRYSGAISYTAAT